MKRKSSRRDFLKGKAATDAVADAAGRALPDEDPQGRPKRAPGASYLVHVARRAMACEFEVRLPAGQSPRGTQLALEALDLVEELEAQISVFQQGSEICQINRTAARKPVEVEPRLFELLELSMRLHGETGGAFDLTSTPLWEVWGFARRAGTIPDPEQLAEARRRVGSHQVELDGRQNTVRFLRPGVQLNLGSIGKGYALDRCAERLVEGGVQDVLIHGGQSSVLARGSQAPGPDGSTEDSPRGWGVGIRHPFRPGRRLAEIRLCHRGLGTSSSWSQSFMYKGRRYGHILDPRTGQPAEGILSATVVAPTAAMADGLSTAFYVMGPQEALDYCRQRPEIATVLVCPTRRGGGIDIQTAGLAEDELTMLQ